MALSAAQVNVATRLKGAYVNVHPNDIDALVPHIVDPHGMVQAMAALNAIQHLENATTDASQVVQQQLWEMAMSLFRDSGAPRAAIQVMSRLYFAMCRYQTSNLVRIHKGMPLVWMGDNYRILGMPWHAYRFTLLAFVEDVLEDNAFSKARGAWFRLYYNYGIKEPVLANIAQDVLQFKGFNPEFAHMWPELCVAFEQNSWPVQWPDATEYVEYESPQACVAFLWSISDFEDDLGIAEGDVLSWIAAVLCSSLTGSRCVGINEQTKVYEYDVIVSFDGHIQDFRHSWGRHLICECKRWGKVAGVDVIAHVLGQLETTRSHAAIVFSPKGVSVGQGKEDLFATREIQKSLQRSGKTIIAINEADLTGISGGASFLDLLRVRFDELILDLRVV